MKTIQQCTTHLHEVNTLQYSTQVQTFFLKIFYLFEILKFHVKINKNMALIKKFEI